MPLPPFDPSGDLPEGVHPAPWGEVLARFGQETEKRREAVARLRRILDWAVTAGGLDRLIVFGGFVTAKAEPNDVDVVLVMRDDFDAAGCPPECRPLFDHRRAAEELGASGFWIRPAMLFGEPLESFVAG